MPRWIRTSLSIAVRIAIAAALLAFILSRVDVQAVGHILRQSDTLLVGCAAGVMLVVGLVTSAKWYVLLRALQVRVGLATITRLSYIAVTWNLALPGGESGNLVKAALLARQLPSAAGAVWASMLIDQISLAAAQFIIALVTLTLTTVPPPHLPFWLAIIGGSMLGMLLVYGTFLIPFAAGRVDALVQRLSRILRAPLWLQRLVNGVGEGPAPAAMPRHLPGEWVAPLWFALIRYRGHIRSLLGAIALAVLYYGIIFSAYWMAARGLHLPFSYFDIAWVTAFAGIVALLPITVAGIGVREGLIIYLLSGHGVALPSLAAFSLSVLLLNIILGLPGLALQVAGSRTQATNTTVA